MNIANILDRARPYYASKPICFFKGEESSFSQISRQVAGLSATFLDSGIQKGDRIVVLFTNRPELLVSLFAIWAVGAVAVPINPALAAPEVCTIIDHCEPMLVVAEHQLSHLLVGSRVEFKLVGMDPEATSVWPQLIETLAPHFEVASMQPTDPALIYYTSGTTGMPKGVVISHTAALATVEMFSRHLMVESADRLLITGPMAFILHLTMNALTGINGGASIVILEKFHPDVVFKEIDRYQITVLIAVPTAYTMMLNSLNGRRTALPSVRWAISAGAAFPETLSQRILHGLGIPVFDLWGMTECGPITTYDPARDKAGRPDSCGRLLPSCEIRIIDDDFGDLNVGDVGEVILRCPGLMSGYYKNARSTSEAIVDGWMRSGDLGKLDADGFLYIVGRKKDLIIRGGANIYPVDIEDVLYSHQAVGECAVVGVPDQTFGEVVKAFVVIREGMDIECSALLDYCRCHIAEYKVPSQIEIVEALPKGATGKILRGRLRDMPATKTS